MSRGHYCHLFTFKVVEVVYDGVQDTSTYVTPVCVDCGYHRPAQARHKVA